MVGCAHIETSLRSVLQLSYVGGKEEAKHLLEHGFDCILGSCGDTGPGVRVEVYVPFQDGVEDLLLCLAPEGRHTAQQDVQNHATAPNICLRPIVPLQNLLETIISFIGSV